MTTFCSLFYPVRNNFIYFYNTDFLLVLVWTILNVHSIFDTVSERMESLACISYR